MKHAPAAKSRPWRRLRNHLAAGVATANGGVLYEVVPVYGTATLTTRIKTATNGGTIDVIFVGPDFDPLQESVRPSFTTALAGANNDVKWRAREAGFTGEGVTIRYLDPGAPNQALVVSNIGRAVTVSLATNGGSSITSTANEVRAAVAANVSSDGLLFGDNAGADTGVGVVTAMAVSTLVIAFADLVGTQYTTGNPTQVPVTAATEALISAPCKGEGYAIVKFGGLVGAGTITYCDVSMLGALLQ